MTCDYSVVRLTSHKCGDIYATQGMSHLLQSVVGKKAVMVAATVLNMGAHVLEFNRVCGIFLFLFLWGFLPLSCVLLFFHPAWVKEDPKNESILHGRHCGDPEHVVKSTGSRNRAPKFKSQRCSTWAGQSWVSFLPSPCLSFLTSKVGKLKIALHHRA